MQAVKKIEEYKVQESFQYKTEYVLLSNPKFAEIEYRVRESYPKSCILYIDEIKNPYVETRFLDQKTSIEEKRGFCNIVQLFHGTNEKAIDSICSMGFDPSRSKTQAFGAGTYFAKNADYSKHYSTIDKNSESYMFLTDVLVGSCVKGSSGRKLDTENYDNFVDNLKAPSIYVTPYQYGAYPRYVVAFHKNAK
jgi:poly [ADP-ribose] polymerase 7/11/12/13